MNTWDSQTKLRKAMVLELLKQNVRAKILRSQAILRAEQMLFLIPLPIVY